MLRTLIFCLVLLLVADETNAETLGERLRAVDSEVLSKEALLRGDSKRGAIVFFTSPAGCAKCHVVGEGQTPLGPDLATATEQTTTQHIVESLLYPSKSIRKGFGTNTFLMLDGSVVSGIVVREDERRVVLREITNLGNDLTLEKDQVDERRASDKSMMPEGLVSTLQSQRDFLDLVAYLNQVAKGGKDVAARLKPSKENLEFLDDTINLDHAGIIRRMKQRDFDTGKRIYQGLCINCHGADGNTPSLPTARAFGSQALKFGSDPYKLFLTLSHGNGLMAPTRHLSPLERYQVIHYIRERFMKDKSDQYVRVNKKYLESLPKGTENGKFQSPGERDFGPALASQLGQDVTSALTIKMEHATLAVNLHTMDLAGVWQNGFLNLDETQHIKARGEGVPLPKGAPIPRLDGWRWAHEGVIDYPEDDLLPRGPLPGKWLDYHGHYLHEDKVVLSYSIDGREILDLPRAQIVSSKDESKQHVAVSRTLRIGPGGALKLVAVGKPSEEFLLKGVVGTAQAGQNGNLNDASEPFALTSLEDDVTGAFSASVAVGETAGIKWSVDDQFRHVLEIPPSRDARTFEVITFSGFGAEALSRFQAVCARSGQPIVDVKELVNGGKPHWPKSLKTVGYPGFEKGAYSLDTIAIPESTPWNTWFRTSALDFFPDGRMALATYGGDIWVVSGLDDELLNVTWKRFAGGLYEPLGVKVVDEKIYVTCKDRLTRLHDLNGDGEADFYESFSADTDVSRWFHAFNLDLQTDSEGNFYYAKCGQSTHYKLPGAVIKISKDGRKREVFATGFRAPNGMGMLPDDRLVVSDNQGNWMPASKISVVKKGGFYGYVQTHAKKGKFGPDGETIDHTKVVPPDTFDQPFIWMPQNLDNSSGGQIWVGDERWGPLSGRLLHTSFGKGWLYYLMLQQVGDSSQAAIVKLPHDFVTGIMRGRVNPNDGQVYVTGLDGWNGNGRVGLKDKGLQRVRFTGKQMQMITNCQVEKDGLRLSFNFQVDAESLKNPNAIEIDQWNYKWQHSYGSDMYHPETGAKGRQKLNVDSVSVSDDGQSLKIELPNLKPVNQIHLRINVRSVEGKEFNEEVYWTINEVPK